MRRFDPMLSFFLVMTVLNYLVSSASDNMLDYLSFNWYLWFVAGIGCAWMQIRTLSEVANSNGNKKAAPTGSFRANDAN